MPKAKAQNVIDLGFEATQFRSPSDFDSVGDGYIARIISDVALEVEAEVGSTLYAAANSDGTNEEKLNFKRIKNAEMYLTAAELWRRIEQFEREAVVKSRETSGGETISSRALKNAEKFEEQGWNEIILITGVNSRSGSISCGVSESGNFNSLIT